MSMYLLPLGLDKAKLVATTVAFFAVVNYLKLGPYRLTVTLPGFVEVSRSLTLTVTGMVPPSIRASVVAGQRCFRNAIILER